MRLCKIAVLLLTAAGLTAAVSSADAPALDLPNRIPEAAPYVTEEARLLPPPYEEFWQTQNHPGQCQTCHQRIFDEWNGSMMSNSWRDPVWRAAFLLLSRAVSTNGDCGTPTPPDGTPKAHHNPFAQPGGCTSRFDLGTSAVTVSPPGSLLAGFCSPCHIPTHSTATPPLPTLTLTP